MRELWRSESLTEGTAALAAGGEASTTPQSRSARRSSRVATSALGGQWPPPPPRAATKDLPSLPLKRRPTPSRRPPHRRKRAGGRSINDSQHAIQTACSPGGGSASVSIGATQVVCSVFAEGVDSRESTMRARSRFRCASRALRRRAAAQGGGRRAADERELSAALHAALVGSVQLEYPKSRVAVHAFVAGRRRALAAAICGALALADASISRFGRRAAAPHTDAVALDCSAAEARGASSEAVVAQMLSLQQLTLLRHRAPLASTT